MDLKDSLRDFIHSQCDETNCTDVEISNIRSTTERMFTVDLSYTWFLNGQEHHTQNEGAIFMYKDGLWYSSLFLPASTPVSASC